MVSPMPEALSFAESRRQKVIFGWPRVRANRTI
jgi:hypothetical protein